MAPKKKKAKKAAKKAAALDSEMGATAMDLMDAADLQSVGGNSIVSKSAIGEKKLSAKSKVSKKQDSPEKKRQEAERKAEQARLAKIEAERIEAERKEMERQAILAAKQVPLRALYAALNEDPLSLVKPLVEQVQAKHLQNIKDGKFVIETEVSAETKASYAKQVREYRVRKLRQALNLHRNELLKKDFDQRNQEITALEQNAQAADWLESYKKLKIKLKGEKVIESPPQVKQVQYYNSSQNVMQ